MICFVTGRFLKVFHGFQLQSTSVRPFPLILLPILCIKHHFLLSYRNTWLSLYFILIFIINSLMLLTPSTGVKRAVLKSTELYDMSVLDDAFKMMPMAQGFKWQLFALLCCCCIGMAGTEAMLFLLLKKEGGLSPAHFAVEKMRNYVWYPLLRAFSRGKFFKFRAVSDQAVDVHIEM